jgi:hypothetical protein
MKDALLTANLEGLVAEADLPSREEETNQSSHACVDQG